ncbi:MAG TPA: aminodeoxychorismate synthase component I [Solirubrobacteraceae bacterium]|jgi:para-aminobenzoate synthetase/4-amino-4-deoxychorismate lyase
MPAPRPTARLLRRPLPWRLAPERAALLVRGDAHPFALIGDWAGGGALIGSEPVRVAAPGEDPFALLEDLPEVEGAPAGARAVGGGWFGRLGFPLAPLVEPVGAPPPRPVPLPAAGLAYHDHLLRLDAGGRWWFEALVTPEREAAIEARHAALLARAAEARPFATAPWRAVPGPAGHATAVAALRERIHAGDLFQANLCLRLESALGGDLLDLFAAGVAALAPERAAFVAGPWGAVASLSPELFLARDGRSVRSAPIKGTRPRPADPGAAAAERAALAASEKDRAENVMIVDLVRNDLGRVCEPGSVQVDALCEVRPHAGVWHLVSEVRGRLRDGAGDAALLRATFPPGSVTGAPKVAALRAIAELESTGRETYTGAIGFAGPLAGLELSVAIRTFECRGDRVWLGVGGGVVADSDPDAEARECLTKAAPLLAAIGARMAAAPARPAAAPPPRLGPRPLPRPDPARGVFETVLAADGRPAAAAQHLERLAASCLALYGAPPPPEIEGLLHDAAARCGRGRVRLTVRPQPDRSAPLVAEVQTGPLPASGPPQRLRPVTLPGGWGSHKWRDRRWLDALAADLAPGELALLVDLDGLVLESTRANVFIREGPALLTPPADGRILPGVTRARVLAQAGASEAEIPLQRLREADEVLLTGALRGVEPADVRLVGRRTTSTAPPRMGRG